MTVSTKLHLEIAGDRSERARLVSGENHEPHRLLGAHPLTVDGVRGAVVRAYHPDAHACDCVFDDGRAVELRPTDSPGVFAAFVPNAKLPMVYRLRMRFADGHVWMRDDPYRFMPSLGDTDLHLFNEGTHRQVWNCLGAHVREMEGVRGVAFAVWAPNARRVSVVGGFCNWDGRIFPMRQMGSSGVYELFIPGLGPGTLYKYEIKSRDGRILLKADPYSYAMEHPPGTASVVYESDYSWSDAEWMARRRARNVHVEPMAIYEVHFGSWLRGEDGRPLNYRQLAPRLIAHCQRFGFNYIEPMPLAEHPFGGSWGYQVSGYYAPTARYGTPDDFRAFVDQCHAAGIGVIVDWVPAHFPKDDFALRRFDGTALFEHEDPRRGEHPDWGTLIFNYGRNEVRNFLIGNALYWLKELHVDGLRVDAVASMLYLDYSRKDGEWLPNAYGGRENLEAIDFLRTLNGVIQAEEPGAIMIAEESTAWGGVTRPPHEGGLGFTFKWNMGWMNDTLRYFSKEPVHRRFHHNDITFAMVYEYTERFINPLSHDEVVHGKGSLLAKMPGDLWQQFANLRLLLTYQYTRPGKILLFQGTELAPWYEWHYEHALDWGLAQHPERAALQRFLEDLGRMYHEMPCLWRSDANPAGCAWIDCHDSDNSVLSFYRRDGGEVAVIVMNMTPVPRGNYRLGMPEPGRYVERFSSDDPRFGGSAFQTPKELHTEPAGSHGFAQSAVLQLPPLGAVVLIPARG